MLMKKSKLKKSIILLLAVTSIILNGCAKQETDLRSSNSHLGHTGMPGSKATGGYSEDITMAEIKEAVVDMLGDNYWPDSKIDAVSLEQIYGISSDMYEDFFAERPSNDTNVDTLIIIKAKSDQVDQVEKILREYQETNIADCEAYSQNLEKTQAARIETFHNYVCFVQLGADTRAANDISSEAVVDQCLEENERTLDAIEKALLR